MPALAIQTTSDAWRRVIEAWAQMLAEYEGSADAYDPDVGYWHNENALTGLLAAATWKAGGIALLEFDTERIYPVLADCGPGNGDAWLRVGGAWHTVEAKISWTEAEVPGYLTEAADQLGCLPEGDRLGTAVAICYCVPGVAPSCPTKGFIEQVGRRLLCDRRLLFRLVYECEGAPLPDEDDGYRYPGMIAVAVEEAWRPLPQSGARAGTRGR